MTRLVNKLLGRVGLELRRPELAKLQATIIDAHEVDCVLDIGANVGQFGRYLRGWGYRGPIVSYEPLPSAFSTLTEATASDRGWRCHNLAVGRAGGEVTINEAAFSSVSSLLDPTDDYHRFFGPDRGSTNATTVRMVTLAEVLRDLEAERIYLKTDTQGYDMEVIRSADTLGRVVAIQCELPIVPLYEDSALFRDALDEIDGLGFVPSGFFPVVQDRDGRLVELDGVFVRRGLTDGQAR